MAEKLDSSFDDQKRTSVSRVIVDGDGRPLAEITADDTEANRDVLLRLEKLDIRSREALDELLSELEDFEPDDSLR